MKNVIYLGVLAAFIAGFFHERWQVGILTAEVKRLELKCSELEARDVIRADATPQRWGQEYLNERIHR